MIHTLEDAREKNYYNWLPYEKKFGLNTVGLINDHVKVSMYITKYITKDLDKSVTELNSHLYYCSWGLKTAELVSEGQLYNPLTFEMSYEGLFSKSQYCESYDWFKQFYEEINE